MYEIHNHIGIPIKFDKELNHDPLTDFDRLMIHQKGNEQLQVNKYLPFIIAVDIVIVFLINYCFFLFNL